MELLEHRVLLQQVEHLAPLDLLELLVHLV
jgi:hypothetical protein